ncbi:hypothetical protein B4U79_18121 [Dinothrombium tinctorium]|uniref:Uncharacterized protein n=1 Tax=Dinothrombium tinctorium TaxID=1965070 RepID=A0A443QXB3_9ACAR|nr:hypothetical protein B4U79_18201 [Dinothrombium tinctorium]RWS09460.1 hypothetical protein B4U79_18121 [Dinothrombium tinctorium]
MVTKIKILRTTIVFSMAFLIGMCNSLFSNTLLDFVEILQSSVEQVSVGLTIRSIGACIGAIGGVILKYGNKIIICAICTMSLGKAIEKERLNLTLAQVPSPITSNSRIWIPFSIFTSLCLFVSIITICNEIYFKTNNVKATKTEKKSNERQFESCGRPNSLVYKVVITSACCFATFCACGVSISFQQFWVVFAVHANFNVTKATAVLMQSPLFFSSTIGTLIVTVLAIKIRAAVILSIQTTTIATGSVLLLIYASRSSIMLWIGGFILSLCVNSNNKD